MSGDSDSTEFSIKVEKLSQTSFKDLLVTNNEENNIYRQSQNKNKLSKRSSIGNQGTVNIIPLGNYTNAAFGNISITENNGELRFAYGLNVYGYLAFTEEVPLEYMMFMDPGSTFWQLTKADEQVILC